MRYALCMTNPTVNDHRKLQDFQHVKGYTMPTVKPEFDIVNFGDATTEELEAMAKMDGLASRLRARALEALRSA